MLSPGADLRCARLLPVLYRFLVSAGSLSPIARLLCMDTSYLHWTRNNTEKERIILLMMVWHPDLTPKERRVLEYLDCLISSAAGGKPLPLHPPVAVEGSA